MMNIVCPIRQLLVSSFLTSTACFTASAQAFWNQALTFGGRGQDAFTALAPAPGGGQYAVGLFNDTITLGGQMLIASADYNGVVVRLDAHGQVRWARQVRGSEVELQAVASDAAGNCYIGGNYDMTVSGISSLEFDSVTSLTNRGRADGFVVKYDSSGHVLWATALGGPWLDRLHSIAVDAAGNCYATGPYNISASFDSITVAGYYTPAATAFQQATCDTYLTKLDPMGHVHWVRTLLGPSREIGRFVALTTGGDVILSSLVSPAAVTDSGAVLPGGSDALLAQYSPSGILRWVRAFGRPQEGHSLIVALVPDLLGGLYAIGNFSGNLTLSATDSVSTTQPWQGVVMRLTETGDLRWARYLLGNCYVQPWAGCLTSTGQLAIAGQFGNQIPERDSLQVSGQLRVGAGARDGFLAAYDSTGVLRWLRTVGGPDRDILFGINPAPGGQLWVAGYYRDTLSISGSAVPPSAGDWDGLLLRFADPSIVTALSAEVPAANVSVWPNPSAGGVFSVRASPPLLKEMGAYTVTDALGRTVAMGALSGAETTLDLRAQAAGVYALRLTWPDGRVVTKQLVR